MWLCNYKHIALSPPILFCSPGRIHTMEQLLSTVNYGEWIWKLWCFTIFLGGRRANMRSVWLIMLAVCAINECNLYSMSAQRSHQFNFTLDDKWFMISGFCCSVNFLVKSGSESVMLLLLMRLLVTREIIAVQDGVLHRIIWRINYYQLFFMELGFILELIGKKHKNIWRNIWCNQPFAMV